MDFWEIACEGEKLIQMTKDMSTTGFSEHCNELSSSLKQ
jgi:hypothetical protein